VEAEV
jgi:hypothetical protein